jgi:hypothetical protein
MSLTQLAETLYYICRSDSNSVHSTLKVKFLTTKYLTKKLIKYFFYKVYGQKKFQDSTNFYKGIYILSINEFLILTTKIKFIHLQNMSQLLINRTNLCWYLEDYLLH